MQERSFFTSKPPPMTRVHLSLFTCAGSCCQDALTPLVLPSWEVWREELVLLLLDMWTTGAFCVMTPNHHIWWVCVCVSLLVLVWRLLPHLGGSPAVLLLTCLDSVLQTPGCHSRLPDAHLRIGGETWAVCVTTQCLCLCVCRGCLSERVCICVCVQVRICVLVVVCMWDTGRTCIPGPEALVFTPSWSKHPEKHTRLWSQWLYMGQRFYFRKKKENVKMQQTATVF